MKSDHEVYNSVDDIPNKMSVDIADQLPDLQEPGRGYTSDSELYRTTNQSSLNDISTKWDFVAPGDEFLAKNRSAGKFCFILLSFINRSLLCFF